VLSDEVALALAKFFDKVGPSHDELSTLMRRAGLSDLDPHSQDPGSLGKMKRVRAVLLSVPPSRAEQASDLVRGLIDALRSHGSFVAGNPNFVGSQVVSDLRSALRRLGYVLEADGLVYPVNIDALEGAELSEALESYVRRAMAAGTDNALLIGNAKDLLEAVSRHAIESVTGTPWTQTNFDATLFQCFDRLGLSTPPQTALAQLDRDPEKAFEQAIWLLGITTKRLRNEFGTGHGRTTISPTARRLGRITSQAGGLVSRFILDRVNPKNRSK